MVQAAEKYFPREAAALKDPRRDGRGGSSPSTLVGLQIAH